MAVILTAVKMSWKLTIYYINEVLPILNCYAVYVPISKLTSLFHHLSSVSPKQCELANLGQTREAGKS